MLGAAITDIKLSLTAGNTYMLFSLLLSKLLSSKENNIYVFPAAKLSLISVIAAPNITY
jgi:hypothetical protein